MKSLRHRSDAISKADAMGKRFTAMNVRGLRATVLDIGLGELARLWR